jgi:hypothetical protein
MVVEVPRPVVQKKCPRARFYARDFRQQITAIALAIVTRFFAAATMRKLQRVAIQQASPIQMTSPVVQVTGLTRTRILVKVNAAWPIVNTLLASTFMPQGHCHGAKICVYNTTGV